MDTSLFRGNGTDLVRRGRATRMRAMGVSCPPFRSVPGTQRRNRGEIALSPPPESAELGNGIDHNRAESHTDYEMTRPCQRFPTHHPPLHIPPNAAPHRAAKIELFRICETRGTPVNVNETPRWQLGVDELMRTLVRDAQQRADLTERHTHAMQRQHRLTLLGTRPFRRLLRLLT